MELLIQIDCDNVQELLSHLTVLRKQIKTAIKEDSLEPDDEFESGDQEALYDSNCYGTHKVFVK